MRLFAFALLADEEHQPRAVEQCSMKAQLLCLLSVELLGWLATVE